MQVCKEVGGQPHGKAHRWGTGGSGVRCVSWGVRSGQGSCGSGCWETAAHRLLSLTACKSASPARGWDLWAQLALPQKAWPSTPPTQGLPHIGSGQSQPEARLRLGGKGGASPRPAGCGSDLRPSVCQGFGLAPCTSPCVSIPMTMLDQHGHCWSALRWGLPPAVRGLPQPRHGRGVWGSEGTHGGEGTSAGTTAWVLPGGCPPQGPSQAEGRSTRGSL